VLEVVPFPHPPSSRLEPILLLGGGGGTYSLIILLKIDCNARFFEGLEEEIKRKALFFVPSESSGRRYMGFISFSTCYTAGMGCRQWSKLDSWDGRALCTKVGRQLSG
jgi:hypothetical protein